MVHKNYKSLRGRRGGSWAATLRGQQEKSMFELLKVPIVDRSAAAFTLSWLYSSSINIAESHFSSDKPEKCLNVFGFLWIELVAVASKAVHHGLFTKAIITVNPVDKGALNWVDKLAS